MRLIVIEGCDGTGTSTHTDALVYNLRESGYAAIGFHHPPPPKGCSPWTRVSHYASERSKLVDQYGDQDVVVVADRWYHSTLVFAAIVGAPLKTRLHVLATMERHTLPAPVMLAVLDASDAELDRRLIRRGEVVRSTDTVQRDTYRNMVCPEATITLDTEQSKDMVRGKLLDLSLACLTPTITTSAI